MALEPRPEILRAAEIEHGALDHAELARLGLRPADVLDFSSNTNPYGPAPGVLNSLVGVSLDHYPDRDCVRLRAALAEFLRISPQQIVAGNGVSELLWLVAMAFLRAQDRVLI